MQLQTINEGKTKRPQSFTKSSLNLDKISSVSIIYGFKDDTSQFGLCITSVCALSVLPSQLFYKF